MSDTLNLAMNENVNRKEILHVRSKVLKAIRDFFLDRDFVEVETPVRVGYPALELHIDAEPSGASFLRTSPELHMKRMLVEGFENIFQMGPCFRQGEHGHLHAPEFTMLEWYRRESNYMDILLDTKALLVSVAQQVLGRTGLVYQGREIELGPVWEVLSVRDAFIAHAGWDPVVAFDFDRFDLDLVEKVEPALPQGYPVVLKDYPVEQAALARCREGDPPVAERWELYVGGIELANAFSELMDADEQRRRFEACAHARREAGRSAYDMDEAFLAALSEDMPPCGGIALGVDRLVMLLADAGTIDQVRAFKE